MTKRTGFTAALAGAILLNAAASAQQQQQQPPPPASQTKADEAPQRPLFRGGARFVRVDVFPTDRDGVPIEGLKLEDFEIYENGQPQQIDSFEFVRIEPELEEARIDPNTQREGEEAAKDPRARLFVIVLDTRHVDVLGGARIRRPLIDLLDRLIGPRDLFGVITPQLRPSDLILGRKAITVADELQRRWSWGVADSIQPQSEAEKIFEDCFGGIGTTRDARIPHNDPSLTAELVERMRERETLDHLTGLVEKLGSIRDEKKAVIVVTQGWSQFARNDERAKKLGSEIPGVFVGGGRISLRNPQTPQYGASATLPDPATCLAQANALLTMDSRQYFRELLSKAQRANVSFYPVDPRGLAVFDTPISRPVGSVADDFASLTNQRDGLMTLANNTDGMALISSNDLHASMRKLSDSLSAYYLLGYYSTNTKFDGGYRRLEVKVKKPDIKLKARRGYYAPTQEEIDRIAAGRAAAAAPVPAEVKSVSDALARLGELRHDRDLFVQAARAGDTLIISAELGVNARQAAAWQKGGELRLLVSAGGEPITETRPLDPLQPGVIVRVPAPPGAQVRIEARARSAAGGAADTTFALPETAATLIGDVLSYRGIARALVAAADGRYRRTERATIEAPIPAGVILAGARLLDRQGKALNVPVTTRERIDPQGVRWMAAEVVLAPLSEGDYLIEMEVMKDAARERKLFAIRVVR